MELKIGVLLDEPKILPGFDYTFYEVKPWSGRILQPLPQSWNVVNCFADNTKSQTKPAGVATYEGNIAKSLQREMVRDRQMLGFFEERGCSGMVQVLER